MEFLDQIFNSDRHEQIIEAKALVLTAGKACLF